MTTRSGQGPGWAQRPLEGPSPAPLVRDRSLSGGECASALGRAGYDVELVASGYAAIQREGVTLVYVPLIESIRPMLLNAILNTLGIDPERFSADLDADRASRPPER